MGNRFTRVHLLAIVADIQFSLVYNVNYVDHNEYSVANFQPNVVNILFDVTNGLLDVVNNQHKLVSIRQVLIDSTHIACHRNPNVHDIQTVFCHIKPNLHDTELIFIDLRRFVTDLKHVATYNLLI